ncbi:hypothetical protein, partial [Photobacterium sp. DNB22_13_2]
RGKGRQLGCAALAEHGVGVVAFGGAVRADACLGRALAHGVHQFRTDDAGGERDDAVAEQDGERGDELAQWRARYQV